MEYEVRLSKRSIQNLRNIYISIRAVHSPLAEDWFRGLEAAIFSLEEMPHRCPITPERPALRHLLYGDRPRAYRVIFSIDEAKKIVNVAQIRHWARKPI